MNVQSARLIAVFEYLTEAVSEEVLSRGAKKLRRRSIPGTIQRKKKSYTGC
jgi:hypothetical protein